MKKAPAFQFYAKDWLSSANVRNMSMRHRGVYISVLAAMWDSDEPGTLPLPIKIAARSAGLDPRSLIDFVSKWPRCLIEIDGKLVNEKLRAQWEGILQRQQVLSDAAKSTNAKRWGSQSPPDSPSDRSASASASASAKPKTPYSPPQAGDRTPPVEKLEHVQVCGSVIEVVMGNRKRIFTESEWGEVSILRPEDVVAKIRRRGFPARIVSQEEVASWSRASEQEARLA